MVSNLTVASQYPQLSTKGPMGALVPHAVLVKNSSMVAEVDEFRTEHNLPPMRFFSVPSPATPPAPTPAPAANQPAQRVPQRQPPRTRAVLQLRDCYNMSLADIMKHEGFLNQVRKTGLAKILQATQGRQISTSLDSMSKDLFIDSVISLFEAQGVPVQVIKLLNDPAFLDQLTVYGLDMIQYSLNWRSDGNHAAKKNCILQHLPLDITIEDDFGTYQRQITRADTVKDFVAKAHNHRRYLSVDDQVVGTSDLYASLGSLGFNDGCTITITNRYPAPQDSSCQYVDISNQIDIEYYRTIERIEIERIELISGDHFVTSCSSKWIIRRVPDLCEGFGWANYHACCERY